MITKIFLDKFLLSTRKNKINIIPGGPTLIQRKSDKTPSPDKNKNNKAISNYLLQS